jgi:hypothetical protein
MTQTLSRAILFISLLALSFLVACTRDPFPNIMLPVHPRAINPEIKYNAPFNGAKAAAYKIRMPFPAQELTTFYDTELQKMGYERVPEDTVFTFHWMNFNYKSGEWEKTTIAEGARYTAAWVDHQKTTKIWLYIAYRYDGANAEWNVTPVVSVNMAKLSDIKYTK